MPRPQHQPTRHRQRGYNLVELMVAMAIGVFLVGGALTVFVQGNASQRASAGLSRLQENGRFAADQVTPDVRLAGMWGLTHLAALVDGRSGTTNQLGTLAGDCASRWYINLNNRIEGADDSNPYSATCLATSDYVAGTDVLVVRHVSADRSVALSAGRVYVHSDLTHAELFVGTTAPTGYASNAEDHALIVHAYYVRPYSYTVGDGIPMLRRKSLSVNGNATALTDEEVVSGIEDMQVQYGMDADGNGSVDKYVDADSAAINLDQVVSLRLWFMARSETVDRDFTDAATYSYATVKRVPNDHYHRMLFSTTILIRNKQT